tara:strand:- start:65 stop:319 length:255 start_codon:yes stop_codon:yes gene_type:complete
MKKAMKMKSPAKKSKGLEALAAANDMKLVPKMKAEAMKMKKAAVKLKKESAMKLKKSGMMMKKSAAMMKKAMKMKKPMKMGHKK